MRKLSNVTAWRRIVGLFGGVATLLVAATPVSAHANLLRAEPGISVSVPTAPTSVRLSFSETPELRYSEINVFNAAHDRFDNRNLRVAPDDPDSLIIGVRDLPQGIYTVVWKTTSAVDGHTTGGSFAFGVRAPSITATAGTQSTVSLSTPTPLEVATKWLLYLSVSVFFGTLILGLFVWTPAIAVTGTRRESDEAFAETVNKRLGALAEAALFALAATTVISVLVQLAKATGQSLLGVLDVRILHDYLVETRTGSIWMLRLVFAFATLLILSAKRLTLVRGSQREETLLQTLALLLGIALGANFLLTIALISHGAATAFATRATVAIDWLHLLATAVWIGGLVGLVATVPLITHRSEAGRLLLRGVVARFSTLALACVAVLGLTGLYSAWVHIGSLGALASTDYGRALVIKLVLVVGLIALGAFNMLWVRPQLALRAAVASEHDLSPRPPVRHFRRSIGAEMLLGAGILLVVAILTGLAPSREALTQTGTTNLTQRAKADDLTVTLTPSTLQPGTITYDVFVTSGQPVGDAQRVTLRFASPELGADESEAVTTVQGDGHYIVTGAYTALTGNWQVRVIMRRAGKDDASATFTLPIGGTAVPAPVTNAATPVITAGTLVYGTLAILFVAAILIGAPTVSKRLIARHTQVRAIDRREKASAASGQGTPRGE